MVFKGKPRYDLTLRQSRAGHCVPIPDKGRVAFIGGGLPACRNVKVRPRIFTAKGFCRILPNHITEFLIAGFSDWRQPHGHRDRRSAESPYKTQGHGGAKAINCEAGARQTLRFLPRPLMLDQSRDHAAELLAVEPRDAHAIHFFRDRFDVCP